MSAYLLGLGFRADMGTCIRKLVLLKLIDACEDDGSRIFPAIATIARAAQCSSRQAQREIRAMLDAGLLHLVREGGRGPRSTNEYRLDLDMLGRIAREGWEVTVGGKGDTQSPLEDADKGDTGDTIRVTPVTDKGDNGSRTTPPDPSPDPSIERERASEREDSQPDAVAKADTPGTADFSKRVIRLCNGRGYAGGPWTDWDTASPKWIEGNFAKLTSDERREAERWRDPYLADLRARGKAPAPIGVWLAGKTWTGLDPAVLERFGQRKAGGAGQDESVAVDGWAACLGNVGMVWLVAKLLGGPANPELAARPLLTEPQLREAWPAVWWWQAHHRQRGGAVFDPIWHERKHMMEFVPQGTEMLAQWRSAFVVRGWRWLPAFDGGNGVWLPKGGPAGLGEFEAAVRGEAVEAAA